MTAAAPIGAGTTAGGRRTAIGRGVSLRGVTKHYDDLTVIPSLDLDIAPGELVTLLGPSGSGKTTTLMMVTGFTAPSGGAILIDGRDVTYVPPHRRNVGVVFQQYALFPHMTVAENVAFPLQMRGITGAAAAERVRAALDLVELSALAHRFPAALSGGQQQRVAFARAIVFDPPVLLLDEPLGALDKKLRETLQIEIKALHDRLGLTMIYVTHDQSEALAISDRAAVMNHGRIEQIGAPAELYERPATRFVADFIGEASVVAGRAAGMAGGWLAVETAANGRFLAAPSGSGMPTGRVELVLRPEAIAVGVEAEGLENRITGTLLDSAYVGEATRYRLRLPGGEIIVARVPNRRGRRTVLAAGEVVPLGWHPADAMVFPVEGKA